MAVFQLLQGRHRQKGKSYFANDPKNNKVESDADLVGTFGSEKFRLLSGQPKSEINVRAHTFPGGQVHKGVQRTDGSAGSTLDESVPTEPVRDELNAMDIDELKMAAEQEEVEVEDAASPQEVIDAIRKARAAK